MTSISAIEYVKQIEQLKEGDLGILRGLKGCKLHKTLSGFDLFSGLWWEIRQRTQYAPRRDPAWLVLKLYACNPIPYIAGQSLPAMLGKLSIKDKSMDRQFDGMINLPISMIEQALHELLAKVRQADIKGLDWAELTDDLSFWNDVKARNRWIYTYDNNTRKETKEVSHVD